MHIHLDPIGGLAGDMFVAAMLDAFPALEAEVQGAVRAAGLPDRFSCDLRPHADHALTGKRFLVLETRPGHDHAPVETAQRAHPDPAGLEHARDHQHGHRPYAEIRAGLSSCDLETGVRDHAIAIFTLLAGAEAEVHGATPDTVSFHELGEWDSIADIVAASAIIQAVAPTTWSVGPLPLGSGFVNSAHGLLPVPAPATALLLRGLAVRDDGIAGERVTPTGAAIARHLLSLPGEAPRLRTMLGTGLGFGTRSLSGISNSVRVLAFEAAPPAGGIHDHVTSIEFDVDDQTPEDLAIGLDHVRANPAVLDVLQTPAFGKKGRLVMSVRVLCRAESEEDVARQCFVETTTLGLRLLDVRRHTLSRTRDTVEVSGRQVERKHAERGSHVTSKVEAKSLHEVAGHRERQRLRHAAEIASLPAGTTGRSQ